MLRWITLAAAVLSTGCASMVMDNYRGLDIRAVYLERGVPSASFDMPEGVRAFQWEYGRQYGTCVYTLYAKRDGSGAWIVSGYAKPLGVCELY